jgi:tropomyosin
VTNEQKLAALRLEADTNADRAVKAEDQMKAVQHDLVAKEAEVSGLKNKISLLEHEIQRAEKRVEDVRTSLLDTELTMARLKVMRKTRKRINWIQTV